MKSLIGKVPILIPTLCRFEHLKRCIESLKNNPYSKYTPLIIAVDYPSKEEHFKGYLDIKNYLNTLNGFYSIEIIYRNYNWGVLKNYFELVKYASTKYEYFIFSEDDIEYSPNFIEFMLQGVKIMQNDSNVLATCGYSSNKYKKINSTAMYSHSFCAWGYAMKTNVFIEKLDSIITTDYAKQILNNLVHSLTIIKHDILAFNLLINEILENDRYEDVSLSCYSFLNKNYKFIVPTISKSRNHGCDGSGAHCSISKELSLHEIDLNTTFNFTINKEIKDKTKEKKNFRDILFTLSRYILYHAINNILISKLKKKFNI